jgi:hypothetical protein
VLDRVGEGRIAMLTSDQAWLWSRGYEGGGPQLELLRRLAHWMMGEPELEEEALTVATGGEVTVTAARSARRCRRSASSRPTARSASLRWSRSARAAGRRASTAARTASGG